MAMHNLFNIKPFIVSVKKNVLYLQEVARRTYLQGGKAADESCCYFKFHQSAKMRIVRRSQMIFSLVGLYILCQHSKSKKKDCK